MPGLGEAFRAAREARNLSLSDVSERIHIRTVYLKGIEDEDWSVVAAPVYVRGFLRTYARFLGLDPEAAVAAFNADLPDVPSAREPAARISAARRPRRGPSPWLWLASAFALALVSYVGFNYYQLQQSSRPTAGAPVAVGDSAPLTSGSPAGAAVPAAGEPVGETASAAERRGLVLRLVQRSWVRVVVDGTVPLEGIYPAGTERIFRGKTATVRAGNAGGVDVTVNGREMGTLGGFGEVIERTFTLSGE